MRTLRPRAAPDSLRDSTEWSLLRPRRNEEMAAALQRELSSSPSSLSCTDDKALLRAQTHSARKRCIRFLREAGDVENLSKTVEDERLEEQKVRRLRDCDSLPGHTESSLHIALTDRDL